MSASSSEFFKCSVCLDDLTDPVSTPCGHNFCSLCLNTYWDGATTISCPLCQQVFKKRPELKINVLLRDLINQKQTKPVPQPEEKTQTEDVYCDKCPIEMKVKAVSSCLHCEESLCSEHLKPHKNDDKLSTHELVDPVRKLKARVCKQHRTSLELICHDDLVCVCVLCMKSSHQDHKCVPLKNRLRQKKAHVKQELADVQEKLKDMNDMLKKFKDSDAISEKNTETDIDDIMKIFLILQRVVKMNESGLVTALMMLQKKAKMRSDSMKEKLKTEIKQLERRKSELDQLSQAVDGFHLLQSWNSMGASPDTEDWSQISTFSDAAVGTVRSAINKLIMELATVVKLEMKSLATKEIKRIQQYAVDVKLDCDTANNVLIVSKDGKQVTNGGRPQSMPDNPERFDTLLGVLGKDGFSSGAFYFEVQVEGKTSWDIGIALETVDRKGHSDVCLSNGYAVLMLRDDVLKACDRPPVQIELPNKPKKIGVFVDFEEGEVGFYDVTSEAHIYSFTNCKFPKVKLHPYLNPCIHESTNTAQMVITPVMEVTSF